MKMLIFNKSCVLVLVNYSICGPSNSYDTVFTVSRNDFDFGKNFIGYSFA